MKIHFLGTCSGTEPMPGRKHSAVAIECNNALYWFDAGEGCSYTAHLKGLDLLTVKKIMISHTHMDHVGGLCNLLWNIRKLVSMRKTLPVHDPIEIYMPNMEVWDGIMHILNNTENNFSIEYKQECKEVNAGLLFDDGVMKVTAYPNTHLRRIPSPRCISFSYLIECEGKRLIYTGDLGSYQDLDPMLEAHCDGLILETGHFSMETVAEYTADKSIDRLFFTHHGRAILYNPEEAREKTAQLFENRAVICEDGMTIEL